MTVKKHLSDFCLFHCHQNSLFSILMLLSYIEYLKEISPYLRLLKTLKQHKQLTVREAVQKNKFGAIFL